MIWISQAILPSHVRSLCAAHTYTRTAYVIRWSETTNLATNVQRELLCFLHNTAFSSFCSTKYIIVLAFLVSPFTLASNYHLPYVWTVWRKKRTETTLHCELWCMELRIIFECVCAIYGTRITKYGICWEGTTISTC